ncbi:MAG: hypothetical protein R6X32_05905 [Chloroflexota bacterium]
MSKLNELQRKINEAAAAGNVTEAARLSQIYVKLYKELEETAVS